MNIIATFHSGTMAQDMEVNLLVCTEIIEVVHLTSSWRQFLHTSIYALQSWEANIILQACFKVQSMRLASTLHYVEI